MCHCSCRSSKRRIQEGLVLQPRLLHSHWTEPKPTWTGWPWTRTRCLHGSLTKRLHQFTNAKTLSRFKWGFLSYKCSLWTQIFSPAETKCSIYINIIYIFNIYYECCKCYVGDFFKCQVLIKNLWIECIWYKNIIVFRSTIKQILKTTAWSDQTWSLIKVVKWQIEMDKMLNI